MSGGAGTSPDQQPTTPPASAADRARAAQPETVGDYIARIVAAAPPITHDHPAAACLIAHFKNQPADQPAKRRKTA